MTDLFFKLKTIKISLSYQVDYYTYVRDVDFSCKVTVTDLYCLYFKELVSNVVYADLEM